MKTFEIETPDGRMLRQRHESADFKDKLLPGYKIIGEVFGADSKGNGGMLSRNDEEPLIANLLEGRGGEWLREWLPPCKCGK